jgi:hypothetical protein
VPFIIVHEPDDTESSTTLVIFSFFTTLERDTGSLEQLFLFPSTAARSLVLQLIGAGTPPRYEQTDLTG